MANGFIRIPRTFYESELWQPEGVLSTTEAFLDLTRRINYNSRPVTHLVGGRHMTCERDEVCISVSYLVRAWKWTTKRVRSFLKRLEELGIIRLQRNERGYANTIRFLFNVCTDDETRDDEPQPEVAPTPQTLPLDEPTEGKPKGKLEGKPKGKPQDDVNALTISEKAEVHVPQKGKRKGKLKGKRKGNNIKRIRKQENKSLYTLKREERKKQSEGSPAPRVVKDEALPIMSEELQPQTCQPVEVNGTAPQLVPTPCADVPTLDDIEAYCRQNGVTTISPESFYHYYNARGWCIDGKPLRSWRSALHRWICTEGTFSPKPTLSQPKSHTVMPIAQMRQEIERLATAATTPANDSQSRRALEAYESFVRRMNG